MIEMSWEQILAVLVKKDLRIAELEQQLKVATESQITKASEWAAEKAVLEMKLNTQPVPVVSEESIIAQSKAGRERFQAYMDAAADKLSIEAAAPANIVVEAGADVNPPL